MNSRLVISLTSILTLITIALCAATPIAADETVGENPASASPTRMFWNLANAEAPLLTLPDNVRQDFDLSFALPFGQFGIPLSHSLHYNAQARKYLLMVVSDGGRRGDFFELRQVGSTRVYAARNNVHFQLVDQGSIRVLNAFNGNQYSFIPAADGELRCAQIKQANGNLIRLSYNKDGLISGLMDNSDRTTSIDYANSRVVTLVQTWKVARTRMVKTWKPSESNHASSSRIPNAGTPRLAVAKAVPVSALTPNYTRAMSECDHKLARVFGGPRAIAAANSFEPAGLARQYPIYRGDFMGEDGLLHAGHLSYAMHLYGSDDGTTITPLYVPAGFTSHSLTPTPTDAAVTFFYPRLGNFNNVTLAVFHVADFSVTYENGRVRIGNIGGRGGSYEQYKHSHIEFYRGNTGLPDSNHRASLRINPAKVF